METLFLFLNVSSNMDETQSSPSCFPAAGMRGDGTEVQILEQNFLFQMRLYLFVQKR